MTDELMGRFDVSHFLRACADWIYEHVEGLPDGWWLCDDDGTPLSGPAPDPSLDNPQTRAWFDTWMGIASGRQTPVP